MEMNLNKTLPGQYKWVIIVWRFHHSSTASTNQCPVDLPVFIHLLRSAMHLAPQFSSHNIIVNYSMISVSQYFPYKFCRHRKGFVSISLASTKSLVKTQSICFKLLVIISHHHFHFGVQTRFYSLNAYWGLPSLWPHFRNLTVTF